jgi:tripartite-type tricarboxylate transporter receptor subunit TctC
MAVRTDAPWKTLQDFIAYAKAHPHAIKYGITGFGNTAHLGPAELARETGIEIDPVNFDGGAPLIAALLGGHIEAGSGSPVDYKQQIVAGKLRGLVSFASSRSPDPVMKNIPTAKELGYDDEIVLWQGIFGPKGMPQPVVDKLAAAFQKTLADPTVQAEIRKLGVEPVWLGPDEWGKRWMSAQARMKQIVTDTGILDIVKSQTK